MAEGGELSTVLDCPICMEGFSTPVCLPCGHTFCLSCISHHAQSKKRIVRQRDVFDCPTCRRYVEFPSKGLDHLPRNFSMDHIREVIMPAIITCHKCSDVGHTVAAVWRCVQCDVFLCGKCRNVHSFSTTNAHHIVQLDTVRSNMQSNDLPSFERCLIHPMEILRSYCVQCKMLICRDCIMEKHQNHEVESIKKAAATARENFDIVRQEKEIGMENLKKAIKELENHINTLEKHRDIELAKTRSHTNMIIEQIKRKAKYMEDEILSTIANSVEVLQADLDTFKRHMSNLQSEIYTENTAIQSSKEVINLFYTSSPNRTSIQYESFVNTDVIESLYTVQFTEGNQCCLNLDDVLGNCKKQLISSSEVRSQFEHHIVSSDSGEKLKIRDNPHLVTSFETCVQVSFAGVKPDDDIVFFCPDVGLITYKEGGHIEEGELTCLKLPRDNSLWNIHEVTLTDTGSLAVMSYTLDDKVGGCYFFNRAGYITHRIVMVDVPVSAALVTDDVVVLLAKDDDELGWLEIVTVSTGERNATTRDRMDQAEYNIGQPRCMTVNKDSRDVIVTHEFAVTAFCYTDLNYRWTYYGEGNGELHDPWGVCVDRWGRVLVLDSGAGKVIALSVDGEYLTNFPIDRIMQGFDPGSFALTKQGHIALIDKNARTRVCIVDYLEKETQPRWFCRFEYGLVFILVLFLVFTRIILFIYIGY